MFAVSYLDLWLNAATNLPETLIEDHSNGTERENLALICVYLQGNWLDVAEEIDDMFLGDAEVE